MLLWQYFVLANGRMLKKKYLGIWSHWSSCTSLQNKEQVYRHLLWEYLQQRNRKAKARACKSWNFFGIFLKNNLHSFYLSLFLSFFPSLYFSLSLSFSLSIYLSLSLSLSIYLSLSISLFLSFSFFLLSLFSFSLFLSLSLSFFLSLSLSLSLFLSRFVATRKRTRSSHTNLDNLTPSDAANKLRWDTHMENGDKSKSNPCSLCFSWCHTIERIRRDKIPNLLQ